MYSEEFDKIIHNRRSNRSFDPKIEVKDEVIEKSLKRAILAPNSSNMQLWEFYWIKSTEELARLTPLCLNQSAAKTAKHMVVFVTRKDLWRTRAKWNYDIIKKTIKGEPSKLQKRGLYYYKKLIPLVYMNDPFYILSSIRKSISFFGESENPFIDLEERVSNVLLFTNLVPWRPKTLCYLFQLRASIPAPWRDSIKGV